MKNVLTLINLFLIFQTPLSGQNLIPNSSFEDVNICIKYHEPCAPKSWRATVLKNFYYWEYLPGVKQSIQPPDGTRSVGFTMYLKGKDFERKFIQTPLICPLKSGEKYELTLYYLVSEATVGEFGIYFTDTLKLYRSPKPLKKFEPQIRIEIPRDVELKKWIKVSAIFTAKGGEKGLILGNFNSDENTEIFPAQGVKKKVFEQRKKRRIYTRFDQITLTPLNETAHEDCDTELNLERLYEDSVKHLWAEPILPGNWKEKTTTPEFTDLPGPEPKITKYPPIVLAHDTIRINESFTIANINFETNSAQLLPTSFLSLDRIRSLMRSNPQFNLKITGHTDDIGSDLDNQKLSENRAQAVADFLIRNGISKYRIQTDGKGESEPIFENITEKNRFKNRRVEFVISENAF